MNPLSIVQLTRAATTLYNRRGELDSDGVSSDALKELRANHAYERRRHPFRYRWNRIASKLAVTFIVALVVAVPVGLIALVLYFLGH
jgi:hypothetical protein